MKVSQPTERLLHPLWVWVIWAATVSISVAGETTSEYVGPTAVTASRDGGTLYVACADAKQVAWIDLSGGNVVRRIDVPAEPTDLLLSSDGERLIVACAAPKSTVIMLDADSGKTIATIPAGHTASGLAVTPDGKRLYVCNRFDNDVSVIDLATNRQITRVDAVREPIAAAVTPDGKEVWVLNHLPNRRTDIYSMQPVSPVVTLIDTESHETAEIELAYGSNALRGICFSPDGKHAYVTHVLGNFERIPTQVDLGWTNMNALSVIDVPERKVINTAGVDELYLGAANPWGVGCTPDGKSICVAHAGTHELSVIDTPVLLEWLSQLFISPLAGTLPEDERNRPDPRRRIKLPGKGPRGLVVCGSKVYVAEYYSDTLAVVDLTQQGDDAIGTIALGPKPQMSERRRGEMLFNDAMICYQQWQSCGSCHPEGRTDALNWDLMNDGAGNPKNTKSMILAHLTAPAMAEGVRETAEAAVRAGMEHILFSQPAEDDAAAIDTYLRSLKPVPSPRLVDGRLSESARRGKKLFMSPRVGCARCHPEPHYTDCRMHNVGSKSMYGFSDEFDTPTLVEVWRTAPYLHDGRYVTVKDLIVEGKHGKPAGYDEILSEEQIDDLVEFVLSL